MRAHEFITEDDPNAIALDLSTANQKPGQPQAPKPGSQVSTGKNVKIALPGNKTADAKVSAVTGKDVELTLPDNKKIKTDKANLVPNKPPAPNTSQKVTTINA